MPTILIADDSDARRRIISSVLQRAGFDVVAVVDGVEAVQCVFRARPDLVILDAQMPRLSGHVVTRLLKDDWQTNDIPVVIITSHETAGDRYRGEQSGADGFLAKDFGAAQLVATVEDVLAASQAQRQGEPVTTMEPVDLADEDVLARVSELLDRKLFEAKICADITKIGSEVHGFEETIAAVLEGLGRLVDFDLAAVCLLDTRIAYLTVSRASSHRQYLDFCAATADVAGNLIGHPVMVTDLVPRVADPMGLLGSDDEDGLAAFLSVPLWAAGRLLGCLAVSSATAGAFSDSAVDALRLIEQPVAVVISNAQLTDLSPVASVA